MSHRKNHLLGKVAEDWKLRGWRKLCWHLCRDGATQASVQGQIVMLRFDCGAVSRASKRLTKELLLLSPKR